MMKHSVFKKLIKNSGTIFFGNSTASALNIVSFSLMAKSVGPVFLAIYALAQTYANLVNDIFNVQTWEGFVKYGSTKLSVNELASLIKTNIVIDTVSAVVAFLFALLLALPVTIFAGWDKANIPILSLYSISILFNSTTLTIGIPRLMREFVGVAKIQIAVAVVKLVSVSLCYFLGGTTRVFIGIYLCTDVLANVGLICFSLYLVKQRLGAGWWSKKLIFNREQLSFIWWSNLRTIIRIPVRHFDIIVISSVISMEALGAYKVYKEITKVISNVSDPVSQAIFPEFTKLVGTGNHQESVALARRAMSAMSVAAVVLSLFLCFGAHPIVKHFFGPQFLAHLNVLYFMIIASAFSFSTSPINSLFIAAGFAKASFYVVLVTNSVYLLAAFWCGSMWGLLGVVLANVIQFVLNKELKILIMRRAGWWLLNAC